MANKTIYLTEAQMQMICEEAMLCEALRGTDIRTAIQKAVKYIKNGAKIATVLLALYGAYNIVSPQQKAELRQEVEAALQAKDNNMESQWKKVPYAVHATVYNAEPRQCNADCAHTASMFRLNLSDVYSHRIIAMERTFMAKLGLKYHDVVYVKGTGKYDGVWQIEDTMNKRFAGQNKIDFLVPKSFGLDQWFDAELYVLKDSSERDTIKRENNLAPQLDKASFEKQNSLIKAGKFKTT